MNNKIRNNIAVCLLIAILGFASFLSWQRHITESSNRDVEITAEYTSLYDLAMTQNVDFGELLTSFKACGLTSVAFAEDTIDKLCQEGVLDIYRANVFEKEAGAEIVSKIGKVDRNKTYILVYSEDTARQIQTFARFSVPDIKQVYTPEKISYSSPCIFELFMTKHICEAVGIGFSKEKIDRCREAGFGIILRPENNSNLNPDAIAELLTLLRNEYNTDKFIFAGPDNDVVGYPSYINDTAVILNDIRVPFGIIESPNVKSMQKGIQTLGLKCTDLAVRVMTIPPLQQRRLTVEAMTEKYSLGIRERNIRLIYIRPHFVPEDNLSIVDLNKKYIADINKVIYKNGLKNGISHPFSHTKYPAASAIVLSFGVLCAFVLTTSRMSKNSGKIIAAASAVWILATVFTAMGSLSFYRKISALCAGIIFPYLAVWVNFPELNQLLEKMTFLSALKKCTALLAKIVVIASAGGILISALLASPEFYIQADMFRGIKLMMILPPLFILLAWTLNPEAYVDSFKSLLKNTVSFMHVFVMGILAGAGGYYLLRTGNSSESSVSSTELSIRGMLTSVLTVRPRFKEFLLGFPAIMAMASLRLFGLEKYAWLTVLCIAIGASDITDTFAHMHTPISITLTRVIYSSSLGWIVGALLLGVLFFIASKTKKD